MKLDIELEKPRLKTSHLTTVLAVIILGFTLFNTYQLLQMDGAPVEQSIKSDSAPTTERTSGVSRGEVLPEGVPEIYGEELDVSFDDVSSDSPKLADQTIEKLASIDREVELTGKDKERYIDILYRMEDGISCEYCCGARSVIRENGEAACGCAHSYAMRGLTKYLITEHGDEFSDEEIFTEVSKWKTRFFPGPIVKKVEALQAEGIEPTYVNIASNTYRGIQESGGGGGMVGDC